jgi:FkbM family methyltransferase
VIVSAGGLRVSLRDRGQEGSLGDRAAFAQVFFGGGYDFLLGRMSPGDIVLDAGANIGCFAIRASRRVGPRGLVIAVEPEPANVERLRTNFRLNDMTNVVVIERALDAVPDRTVNIVGTGTTASVEAAKARLPTDPTAGAARTAVRTITLDEVMEELSLDRFDIVKMDIEGSENSIFATASTSAALATARAVAVEVHDHEGQGLVQNRLRADGYTYVGEVKEEAGFLVSGLRQGIRHPDLVLKLYGTGVVSVLARMVSGVLSKKQQSTQVFGTVYASR